VVQVIPLQEVFVQALSSSAYTSAKSDVSAFEDWLCHDQRILRQDSVLSMDPRDSPDGSPLTYKLIMTEPVLQGYAQKSQTLFTLLPPTEDPPAVNGHRIQSSSVPDDAHTKFDDEDLEIGESFLAGSLVPQPTLYPQQNGSPTISMPLFAHELTARPSSTPIYSGLDDHTMYVRTVDLPKIGVLDGDWVSTPLHA
jgi:peroxin-6